MTRTQLEHIIRAAGAISDEEEIVVIGSQAILAAYPDAPEALRFSREADVYPLQNPDKAIVIDGAIGEISPFDHTFGYYAHGVAPETAILPHDWRQRAIVICNDNTRQVKGICLHPVDIAISKLAAGREKDKSFVATMIQAGMLRLEELADLTNSISHPDYRQTVLQNLASLRRNVGTMAE